MDTGHAVLFDPGGSYAINETTKKITPFDRQGKGWDLTLELEAPEVANKVRNDWVQKNKKVENFKPAISLFDLLELDKVDDKKEEDAQGDAWDQLFRLAAPGR